MLLATRRALRASRSIPHSRRVACLLFRHAPQRGDEDAELAAMRSAHRTSRPTLRVMLPSVSISLTVSQLATCAPQRQLAGRVKMDFT
ncbi:MAG: hypothetical protein SGPRY_012421, partial [Prymnesium sp.]